MPISYFKWFSANISTKLQQYYGLLSEIPKYWKDTIKLPNSQESTASTIDIDRLPCKTVYNLLISSTNPAPPTSDSWLIAYGFDSNKRHFGATKEIKLAIFQYKVTHNILCTNKIPAVSGRCDEISKRLWHFTPKANSNFSQIGKIKALCLCTIYHLIATDQLIQVLTSAAMNEVVILREIAVQKNAKCINLLLYWV